MTEKLGSVSHHPTHQAGHTIGSEQVAMMLGVTRQTLYNYLHNNNPRAPRPINFERFGKGERSHKLIWCRSDVVTHIEAMSSNTAYIGAVWSCGGWKPTVTYHGRRWDGKPTTSAFDAFDEAWRFLQDRQGKARP